MSEGAAVAASCREITLSSAAFSATRLRSRHQPWIRCPENEHADAALLRVALCQDFPTCCQSENAAPINVELRWQARTTRHNRDAVEIAMSPLAVWSQIVWKPWGLWMERRLHTRHRARTTVYILLPDGQRRLCKAVNLSATGVFIRPPAWAAQGPAGQPRICDRSGRRDQTASAYRGGCPRVRRRHRPDDGCLRRHTLTAAAPPLVLACISQSPGPRSVPDRVAAAGRPCASTPGQQARSTPVSD